MSASPSIVLMTADAVGGVWSYAVGLCAALPDIRFVVATLGPPPHPEQRAALTGLGNVLLAESDFRLEWMTGGQADVVASRRWLDGLAERYAVDLVHVNGYAQARLDGKCPTIVVAHSDVLSWWVAVRGSTAPAERRDYRRQVVSGLRAAACVVAPTNAVQHDLRANYGLPLWSARVIPNGADVAAFSPLSKRAVVMAAGRIWDEAKNLRLLDEIAPALAWPVEIAGQTTQPGHGVVGLRHAWPLGVLGPEQMRHRLGEAAIFAAPAHYEPFGLGILEAAAAGCALVLGDIASLRENWDGAAIFVPSTDAARWRTTLARLIEDGEERRQLAAAARVRAEQFSLARTAARYRTLYHELTRASAARRIA